MTHPHFEHKSALAHVVEKQAAGILSHAEIHGMEIPGHISAGADAMRETSCLLLLLWLPLHILAFPLSQTAPFLLAFALGWLVWKTGRSAWLGWARLERLHRLIVQERHEIETNRPQEREELRALYIIKGFEGQLLEDILDVLMADQDRLLKVMLEEELGLRLEIHEHPLKQALGAFLGTACTLCLVGACFIFSPRYGVPLASFLTMTSGATISAIFEKNAALRAWVWNLAIGGLAFGCSYFLLGILS